MLRQALKALTKHVESKIKKLKVTMTWKQGEIKSCLWVLEINKRKRQNDLIKEK